MTLTADIIAAIVKADDEAPVMGQVLDPGETVTFRVAGKQGDQGPQGKVGPEGPQGKRGFDGEIGVMGPQGVEGKEGPVGPEGPQGAPGKVGAKGIKGDTGDIGPEGPAGKDGRPGRDGSVVMTRMAGGGAGGGGGGAALSDAVPLVESGAGAAGAAGAASRGDHVHPADPGGGGAVDSVNGETGVVVLDAADVGAEPSGAVATHAGAANPHPTYETSAEAQAKVDLHTGDATAAHAASAVAFTPAGTISATDVQAAIEEVAAEAGGETDRIPIADPTDVVIDTTTYDDAIEGIGKYTTVVFPAGSNKAALVIAKAGDAFPRIVMTADPLEGTYLGDGTQNPVSDGAASWIEGPDANGFFTYTFEGGGAHQTRFSQFDPNTGYFLNAGTGISLSNGSSVGVVISAVYAGAPAIGGNVGDIAIRQDASGTNDLIYRCTVAGVAGAATWVAQALGGGLAGSAQTYTETNVTTDRAYNANATSIDELADILGTLIADLRNRGVVN